MDAKTVSREIAARIWPELRAHGFTDTDKRAAWRTHDDRIDIIVFRSFNAHQLKDLNPGSFWVELGCHLRYVKYPLTAEEQLDHDSTRPDPADCLLRGELQRGFRWPFTVSRNIWPMGTMGMTPEKVIEDACRVVMGGLNWFDQFSTPEAVSAILAVREESMTDLWGFGRPGSPVREYFRGYVALRRGLRAEARQHFQNALNSGHLPMQTERLRREMDLL